MGTARKFGIVQGGRRPGCFENETVCVDDVWPEVSSRCSREELALKARENSSGRVLFEIFLILAIASLVVVVTTQWVRTFS